MVARNLLSPTLTLVKDPIIWVDLEMTGLDPNKDLILEIAVVVTDGNLSEAIEGPDLVLHAEPDRLAEMEQVVSEMHAASGLTVAARQSNLEAGTAEQQVLEFVREHTEPGVAPLAGNSVHVDRAFLAQQMPELEAHLHYRNIDVSTLKELVRRWDPDAFAEVPPKAGGHRALADIRESIAELRAYKMLLIREDVD